MRTGVGKRLVQCLPIPAEGEHSGALAHEQRDRGAADPGRPPGHEDALAGQVGMFDHGHSQLRIRRPLAGGR